MRFPEMFVDELWADDGSFAESEDMSCDNLQCGRDVVLVVLKS